MSVINDMLRDLDTRNANIDAEDDLLSGLTPVAEVERSNGKLYGLLGLAIVALVVCVAWFQYAGKINIVSQLSPTPRDSASSDSVSSGFVFSNTGSSNTEPRNSELAVAGSSATIQNEKAIETASPDSNKETPVQSSVTGKLMSSVISYGLKQSKGSAYLSLVLTDEVKPFVAQSDHSLEVLLPNVSLPYAWPKQQLDAPFELLTVRQKGDDLIVNVSASDLIIYTVDVKSIDAPDSDAKTELALSFAVDMLTKTPAVANVEITTSEVKAIDKNTTDVRDATVQATEIINGHDDDPSLAGNIAEPRLVASNPPVSVGKIKPSKQQENTALAVKSTLIISPSDIVDKAKVLYQNELCKKD